MCADAKHTIQLHEYKHENGMLQMGSNRTLWCVARQKPTKSAVKNRDKHDIVIFIFHASNLNLRRLMMLKPAGQTGRPTWMKRASQFRYENSVARCLYQSLVGYLSSVMIVFRRPECISKIDVKLKLSVNQTTHIYITEMTTHSLLFISILPPPNTSSYIRVHSSYL